MEKNSHSNCVTGGESPYCPRTDLACEGPVKDCSTIGTTYEEYERSGIRISELRVLDEAGEAAAGRKIGRYTTLHCPVIRYWDETATDQVSDLLAELLRDFTRMVTGKPVTASTKILVAGLGNRFMTADALGPRTADKISVTGHMMGSGGIFDDLGCCSLSAVHPGVMGQTGIESAAMIRGAAEFAHPDAIIAVDALAARSTQRLAATIQLSDTGIAPGSGIGNRRAAINRETVGAPVIALGVPTVVDSATLVYDALEKADQLPACEQLEEVLNSGRSFFVSLRDSDVITDEVSSLLAKGINKAYFAQWS